MKTLNSALLRLLAGLLAVVLLASCSGGDGEGGDPDAEGSDGSEETSEAVDLNEYIEVPKGAELTQPGTELQLKDSATVIWQPRQAEVAVAKIRVQKIERTTFKDAFQGYQITDELAAMTPYFVRAKVRNPLKANLSKLPVPLYLQDDAGTFIEANVMGGKFAPCPGNGVLPRGFKKGKKADLCWVFFLAQGRKLETVSMQMPGGLAPITWSGDVKRFKPQGKKAEKADDQG